MTDIDVTTNPIPSNNLGFTLFTCNMKYKRIYPQTVYRNKKEIIIIRKN